jgi:hypothetical protein
MRKTPAPHTAAETEGVPYDRVDLDEASCQSSVNIGILGMTSWYGSYGVRVSGEIVG